MLGRSTGAACQSCHPVTDAQIDPFNEGDVQPSREAHPLQGVLESGLCPQAHHVRDAHQLAPPVALFYLAIDQTRRYPPLTYLPRKSTVTL